MTASTVYTHVKENFAVFSNIKRCSDIQNKWDGLHGENESSNENLKI
jgi:hypothetical protein